MLAPFNLDATHDAARPRRPFAHNRRFRVHPPAHETLTANARMQPASLGQFCRCIIADKPEQKYGVRLAPAHVQQNRRLCSQRTSPFAADFNRKERIKPFRHDRPQVSGVKLFRSRAAADRPSRGVCRPCDRACGGAPPPPGGGAPKKISFFFKKKKKKKKKKYSLSWAFDDGRRFSLDQPAPLVSDTNASASRRAKARHPDLVNIDPPSGRHAASSNPTDASASIRSRWPLPVVTMPKIASSRSIDALVDGWLRQRLRRHALMFQDRV